MQAAEADELPELLTGALEPVGGQGVQPVAAQAHLGLGFLAECEQPLLSGEQRQTPRRAGLVQRSLPFVELPPARFETVMLVRQVRLGDRRVGVQRVGE